MRLPRHARRIAGFASLLTTLAALATAASVATAAEPASIYGLELEIGPERERLLVFASKPVRYRVVERDEDTLELRIEQAVLDSSAPGHAAPVGASSVAGVHAREEAGEVVVSITRERGRVPEVSSRGSMIAVDFPGLGLREGAIALQFRDAKIADVVRGIAGATGETFLLDPELTGRVTIVVGDRVSPPEALELLDSALLLLGHAALPTPGGPRKIVPIAAGTAGAPWMPDGIGASDRLAATLVRLEAAVAAELAAQLEPWLGENALAIPFAPTNSLILAGAESHLESLLTSIRTLDEAASESLLVRDLEHRSADDLRDMLLDWADGAPDARPLHVVSIPRTETLIVRAAPNHLAEIGRLVDRLDRARIADGRFHVMPIRERDAGEVSDALAGLTSGGGALADRDFAIAVDTPTNSLLVRSDSETASVIAGLVSDLDRSPPQIRVELKVMEITTPESLRLGFDAFVPFGSSDNSSLSGVLLNPSGANLLDVLAAPTALRGAFVRRPLLIPIIDENGVPSVTLLPREAAILTAEKREVRSRMLMRPEILVTSGAEHEIFAGNDVPILVARAGVATPLTTNVNVERREVGLRLRVLPTATETGGVRLELDLEVSSLLPPLAGDVGQVGPTLRQRHLSSVIRLVDDEFAVIGVGEEQTTQNRMRGVPLLMDVPVLGWAFRRTDDIKLVSRLLVAVSARVEEREPHAQASPVGRRLAGLRQPLAPSP